MKIVTERGVLYHNSKGNAVLKWNSGFKREQEGKYNKIQIYLDNAVVRYMDAYVPMRTGMLKKSVILGSRMGSGELKYIVPYAHRQYHSKRNLKGLRGPRWFHRMWAARKKNIINEVVAYARRVMK